MASLGENLQPLVLMAIARQIRQLVKEPPAGVRYIPGEQVTEILAEVDGPQGTPFEGGTFLVRLVLGSDYPAAPPKGYMLTKIFHPNVSLTGEICVNTLKKDWKPENTLAHVLQVISCLLIVPFPESSLNDEAGKLFMESYEEYARKAKLMTGIHATPSAAAAGSSAGGGGAGAGGGGGAGSSSSASAPASAPAAGAAASSSAASARGEGAAGSGSAGEGASASAASASASASASAGAGAGLTAGKSNVDLGSVGVEKKDEKRKAEKDEKAGKSSKSLKRL